MASVALPRVHLAVWYADLWKGAGRDGGVLQRRREPSGVRKERTVTLAEINKSEHLYGFNSDSY